MTKEQFDRLEPCPWGCALDENEINIRTDKYTICMSDKVYKSYAVSCSCGAQGPHGDTPEEAIELWNKRGLGEIIYSSCGYDHLTGLFASTKIYEATDGTYIEERVRELKEAVPEKKYRPFKDFELSCLFEKEIKCKRKGEPYYISFIYTEYCLDFSRTKVAINTLDRFPRFSASITGKELFEHFMLKDGSPCGVEITEKKCHACNGTGQIYSPGAYRIRNDTDYVKCLACEGSGYKEVE